MGDLTNWLDRVCPGFDLPDETYAARFVQVGDSPVLHVERGCTATIPATPAHAKRFREHVIDAADFAIEGCCLWCADSTPGDRHDHILRHYPFGDLTPLGPLLELHAETIDVTTSNAKLANAVRVVDELTWLVATLAAQPDEFSQRLAAAAHTQIDRVRAAVQPDDGRAVAALAQVVATDFPSGLFEQMWSPHDPQSYLPELLRLIDDVCAGDLVEACRVALVAVLAPRVYATMLNHGQLDMWLSKLPGSLVAEFCDPMSQLSPDVQLYQRSSEISVELTDRVAAHDAPLVAGWLRERVAAAGRSPLTVATVTAGWPSAATVPRLLMWELDGLVWRRLRAYDGASHALFVLAGPEALIDGVAEFAAREALMAAEVTSRPLPDGCDLVEVVETVASLSALADDPRARLDAAVQLCMPAAPAV